MCVWVFAKFYKCFSRKVYFYLTRNLICFPIENMVRLGKLVLLIGKLWADSKEPHRMCVACLFVVRGVCEQKVELQVDGTWYVAKLLTEAGLLKMAV